MDSQNWFPDSGASHHITSDQNNFSQQAPYTGMEQVHMGNGQGLPISSIGSTHFVSPLHPHITLSLNNLLHVPTITKNLMSISQFERDNNVFFEFHSDHCLVKSQGSNAILLRGLLGKDGLYCFQQLRMPVKPRSSVSCFVSEKSCSSNLSFSLWHRRLGHANVKAIRHILDLCNISCCNKDLEEFCDACCLGKAHRIHAPPSETVYSKPFELVFSDLWGPSPYVSSCGYSYYITFVDAHTRFTWIYFLKKKSEAINAFKQFHTLITT